MTPSWFTVAMMVCCTICTFLFSKLPQESHAKTFCVYNRVFIEFTEGRSVWGTILLDQYGKPIPCAEEEIKSSTNYNKETI